MSSGLFPDHEPPQGSPPKPGQVVAQVVPERGFDRPGGLTYLVPEELVGLEVGDRVVVPLGRGNTPTPGIVVEVKPWVSGEGASRLKAVASREGARLSGPLVALAHWIANYYCCPIGAVVATMLPAAVKRQVGRRTERLLARAETDAAPDLPREAGEAWRQISALPAAAFPLSARDLVVRLGLRSAAPLTRLRKEGLLEDVVRDKVAALWREGETIVGEEGAASHLLSEEQERAVRAIDGAGGRFAPFLLFGVTGSGKTEVYLRAIRRVIDQGRSAIVLVPEISLTPQTARRFLSRFSAEGVAILHSALTSAQRHQEWRRVAEGRARVVIGARSAVFAPMGLEGGPPLGLIIVDEEHDSSYKQDQAPRYHARDLALKRAQLEGCPVVLGSATPSLESWMNATAGASGNEAARYELLEMPRRVTGAPMPRVRIVDMVAERRARTTERGRQHALGPTLEHALVNTLDAGGQAILLLNRRGYSSYIACPDPACGFVLGCDDCDAKMVMHKDRLPPPGAPPVFVRCHHCRSERKLPTRCPECGRGVVTLGAGTQRLEEELERKIPALKLGETMLRLDSDTMRKARDYFDALERFGSGQVRVMLGTQMIAKGLDFPNVRLVGVVSADTALAMPDFRSGERTFQLLAQVAGRAGRVRGENAEVVVQTFEPDHPAIVEASKHDYPTFAQRELADRSRLGLPPAGRMARVVCRSADDESAQRLAEQVEARFREVIGAGMKVHAACRCPLARLGGEWRWHVELVGGSARGVQEALARSRATVIGPGKWVDVDPIDVL